MRSSTAITYEPPCQGGLRNCRRAIKKMLRRRLQLYVRPNLKHLIRWDLEEGCRSQRIPRHECEQPLAPNRHAGTIRSDQCLAAEKECRPLQRDTEPIRLARRQNLVDVGILHEPVPRRDGV